MKKEFNDTGHCVAKRHYMVDITNRIESIICGINSNNLMSPMKDVWKLLSPI